MKKILLIDPSSAWDEHNPISEWTSHQNLVSKLVQERTEHYNTKVEQAINYNEHRMGLTVDEKNSHSLSAQYITNYGMLMFASEFKKRGLSYQYVNGDYFNSFESFSNECVLQSRNADIVCMTSTTPQYSEILKLAKILSRDNIVVLGGPHAACAEKYIVKDAVFDAIFQGYNVIKACDEIEAILNNPPEIKRDAKNTQVISCPGFINIPKHFELIPEDKIDNTLLYTYTTAGCPNKCAYCCENKLFHNVTFFSIEECLQEILYLYHELKLRFIHFSDNDFLVNQKWASQILDLIENNNIKASFSINVSPNSLTRKGSTELIERFVDLGLIELLIGIEYFSDSVLKLNFKPYDISKFHSSLTQLRNDVKIPMVSFFSMVGLPGENRETIKENTTWWKKFSQKGLFDFSFPKFFVPYPNTDIYDNPQKYGIEFISHDWGLYHRRSLPRPIKVLDMPDELFIEEQAAILALNQ